jgi:branched-chain amino acid transport system permease protein
MKRSRIWKLEYVGLIILLAALALLPSFFSAYIVSFSIITLMFIIMSCSWNIFSGFTGYLSLGHGMFFGAGAYAFTLAMVKGGLPFYYGIALAATVSGILAFLIALVLLTIRIRVAYFAMITLGFNEIFQAICANTAALGESSGFTIPPVPHLQVPYYILLTVAVVLVGGTFMLDRSHVGLALKAISQDEEVADTMGINVTRLKIVFFVLSGVLPGIAGGIMAWFWSYLDPYQAFNLVFSFQVVIIAVLGGMGTVFGPVIAAVFMTLLIEILSTNLPHFYNIIYGVLVTIMIIISPRGMNELIRRIFNR